MPVAHPVVRQNTGGNVFVDTRGRSAARRRQVDKLHFVVAYVSAAGEGRARVEYHARLQAKLHRALTRSVNAYDGFDSAPGAATAHNDFGVSLSLGWTF